MFARGCAIGGESVGSGWWWWVGGSAVWPPQARHSQDLPLQTRPPGRLVARDLLPWLTIYRWLKMSQQAQAQACIRTHTHTRWTEEVSERKMSLAVKGQGAGSSWGAAGTARLNVPLTQNGCYVSKPAQQGLSQPLTISDIAGSFPKTGSNIGFFFSPHRLQEGSRKSCGSLLPGLRYQKHYQECLKFQEFRRLTKRSCMFCKLCTQEDEYTSPKIWNETHLVVKIWISICDFQL